MSVGSALSLSASAIDPAGAADPLSYAWDLNGDDNYSDAAGPTPVMTWGQLQSLGYQGGQTRTIRVQVSDGDAFSIASVSLTVSSNVVTNTSDSGPGSLRQAILDTNATPGIMETITFAIPGGGIHTIVPLTPLPTITDSAIIDGTTQAEYSGTPLIELDGSNAGIGATGLTVNANGSTIRGLAINRFSEYGIHVNGEQSVIAGNFIGTNSSGTAAMPNGTGVFLQGAHNTVGGASPADRNLISGNTNNGVFLGASFNTLIGNYVGTDVTGQIAVGNFWGILANGNNNIIGGVSGAGNVIAGNRNTDVYLNGGTNNVVQGNHIGVDGSGTIGVNSFTSNGIYISGSATNNLIGGTTPGTGNVIGREFWAVIVGGSGTRIVGNTIGGPTVGNGLGLVVISSDTVIGGLSLSDGNILSYNGVGVRVDEGVQNNILSNSIFANAVGIQLSSSDPPHPNDLDDADSGPNTMQNHPLIASATSANGETVMQGVLQNAPNTAYTLQFFSNDSLNNNGFREGRTLLGTSTVSTDADGNASFSVTYPITVANPSLISATATDPNNNTSEFSQAFDNIPIARAGGPYSILWGNSLSLDAAGSSDPNPGQVLSYSWDINGDGAFGDATGIAPTLGWCN